MSVYLDNDVEIIKEGNGGSYTISLKHFIGLKRKDIFQTYDFDIGGCKWKLLFYRSTESSWSKSDNLSIDLRSWNDFAVKTSVSCCLCNHLNSQKNIIQNEIFYMPNGFQCANVAKVNYKKLMDPQEGFVRWSKLVLKLDFNHTAKPPSILALTEVRKYRRHVNVEIFSSSHIESRIREGKVFGAIPRRHLRTCVSSVTEFIAIKCEQFLHRHQGNEAIFFVCERKADGQVHIKYCYESDTDDDTFGCGSEEDGSGNLWTTVFWRMFSPSEKTDISLTTIVLFFCKLYNPEERSFVYAGEVIVSRDDRITQIFTAIAKQWPPPEGKEYDVFVEEGADSIRRLSRPFATLLASGLHSGSTLLIRSREEKEFVTDETIFQELLPMYEKSLLLSDEEDIYEEERELNLDLIQEEASGNLCVVCWTEPKASAFIHDDSGHRCVCKTCAKAISELPNPRCPVCGLAIQNTVYNLFV